MDLLKGKEIMVWTFMGNTRMYQALRDYGGRISQIGLFSFKVKATGEIYESGVLQASNIVLTKHEKPADTGTSVQTKRAGYGQTYYDKYAGTSSSASSSSASTSTVTEQTATDPAKSFNKSLAGTYKTTANLYMRNDAGQGKAAMVVMPKGTSVKNYGYYTSANGVKWLYVQVTYNNIKYTGFCCGTYLKKQ